MKESCYLRPAWTRNGSIRTDLPLLVSPKANKRTLAAKVHPGQLCCVGEVYIKTRDGLIRIR